MNSAGSATKENAKKMDSISGKVQNLKSQFQKLANSLIDSGLLKGLTDFGTILLKIANTGVGQTVIKLTALIIIFNLTKKGIIAVKNELIKMGLVTSDLNKKLLVYSANIKIAGNESLKSAAKFKLSNKAMSGSAKGLEDVGSSMTKVTSTSSLLGNKITGLGKSFKSFGSSAVKSIASVAASIPVAGWIAIGVVAAIGTVVAASKIYEKQVEKNYQKAKKTAKEAESDVKKTEEEIKNKENQIKSLEGKSSLTDIETKKLTIYKEQLKELKKQLGTQKEKVTKSKEELAAEKKKREELAKQNAESKTDFSVDVGGTTLTKDSRTDDKFGKGKFNRETKDEGKITTTDEALKKIEEYNNQLKDTTLTESEINVIKEKREIIENALKDNAKALKEEAYNQNLSDSDRLGYMKEYLNLQSQISPLTYNKDVMESVIKDEDIMKAKGFGDALAKAGEDGEYTKDEIDNLKKTFPKLDEYMDETGINADTLAESFSMYAEETDNAANSTWAISESMETINKNIDSLQSAYETISSAQEEYNSSGYLTMDTMQSLLDLDGKYIDTLSIENGQLNLNKNSYIDMANAQIDAAKAANYVAYAKELEIIAANATGTAIKEEKQEYAALIQTYQDSQSIIDTTGKKIEKFKDKISSSGNEEAIGLMDAATERFKKRNAILEAGRAGLSKNLSSALGGSSKKDSSSSKSEKEWWETELQNLKDQFDYNETTIEEYIGGLSNLLGRVQQGTEAWKKINEELQKQRLSKVEDDYKRGTISLKQYINELKNLQGAYKAGTDAWLELADKIKSGLKDLLDEQKDAYETAHDATMKIIDDEIDKINEQRDATEEYYDKLIEDKEKANEETEKEIELAKLQEALYNAQNEKTKRVFRQNVGWVYETDKTAIDEAQKDLDDFMNEQEIKDLEDAKDKALEVFDEQLEAWDKYKEGWDDVVDEYENQQARLILQQTLGADAEAKILQQRLDVLEKFRNEYNSTLSQIDALEKTSSTNTGALNSIQSNIKGYANGIENGVVDYTGYAKLHGSPSNPEYVLNNGQMKNLLSSLTKPGYSSNIKGTTSSSNTYNFGNIELPNVTNANQFISELKSVVNVTKHQ